MRKMLPLVVLAFAVVALVALAPGRLSAQAQKGRGAAPGNRAAIEKTIVANERALNDAFAKGDLATFTSLVAADSYSIDPMTGRTSTSDFLKQFAEMTKNMKITSWDMTDVQTTVLNQNAAVISYRWSGSGTFQGQPVPSPTWASTVWATRGGKWQAMFHQETPAGPPPKR